MERTKLQPPVGSIESKEVAALCHISAMSVYLWRNLPDDPFPCYAIPTGKSKHKVYFVKEQVIAWMIRNKPNIAKRYGLGGNKNGVVVNIRSRAVSPPDIKRDAPQPVTLQRRAVSY